MTGPAELSVVVPSVNGLSDLRACLDALDRLRQRVRLEVLVVDRLGEEVRAEVRQGYPWARIISTGPKATIPEMRATAFREATAPLVGVIEDHVILPEDWGERMRQAIDGEVVVAGSVVNAATDTLLDWAAFLCEYSHCIPPIASGPVDWLTGNNVVYRRELLERYRPVIEEGKWENRLHDQMRADGIRLVCRPEIEVGHKKHYTLWEYLSQRFLYARSYAGARVAGAALGKRVGYGFAAFALPPLLMWRIAQRILAKKRHRLLLLKSLPLIFIFALSWGFGEVIGYWFGAGDSLSKVR